MTATVDGIDPRLRTEVESFYSEVAAAIDERRPDDWIATFATDAAYSVTSYENHSGGGMRWYTDIGRAKLQERAATTNGYQWVPLRKTLHMITNVRARELEPDAVAAEAYVAVFATNRDGESVLHACGQYHDRLVRIAGQLRFAEHLVVVDAETLPANMVILL